MYIKKLLRFYRFFSMQVMRALRQFLYAKVITLIYYFDNKTQFSIWLVQGNMSIGCTDSTLYEDSQSIFISLASVAGLQET